MEEESIVHAINPSTTTPTTFTTNADKMNYEVISENLSTSSLNLMPMTKEMIAGEANGVA